LRSIADTLPDDPAECLAGFRRLTAKLGREASWQQQFEAEIMRYKCFHWPADYCLEAARQWMNDYRVTENDETLRKLAERAVRNDPQKALSSLGDFPVAIQAELRYEIILRLPASEHERRLELLEQLPLQFWNNSLGESLGRKGEEYAGIVAALPPEKSENLLAGFTRSWAETEPEMVASWLQTLPAPAAYAGSASILADQWFVVDADAASAWLDSLPRDSVRDAAIAKIVDRQAKEDRFDAWRWADTITSPRARVEAYDKIASEWYRNLPPPEEFQDAHRLARQQLGLPAYQIPPKEEPDPFQ
jgi:hypothetical protein